MSTEKMSMAEAVTRDALAERPALARLAAEKAARLPDVPPPADGQPRLDYSATRPEVAGGDYGAAYLDRLSQPRGQVADREAPSGGQADARLDYSQSRPELAGESRLDTMAKGNGLTLAEMREQYLAGMADYRAHRRYDRPPWTPALATDYREHVQRDGPYRPNEAPRAEDREE